MTFLRRHPRLLIAFAAWEVCFTLAVWSSLPFLLLVLRFLLEALHHG